MNTYSKYTNEQIQEVKDLRNEGLSIKDIAELTSIPMGTVGNMLTHKKYIGRMEGTNISLYKRKEVKRESNPVKAILVLFTKGQDNNTIARNTKLPIQIVSTIIEDAIKLGKVEQQWTINL